MSLEKIMTEIRQGLKMEESDSVNYYIKKIEETGDVYAKEAAYREKVEMALKKNCSYGETKFT